jgi:hypothetical protein
VNLTGGARLAVTEGEGVVAGLRKLKVETAFGNYAKAAQAGMGRARARGGLWCGAGQHGRGCAGFGFLNIQRLWKFVGEDLGGILA